VSSQKNLSLLGALAWGRGGGLEVCGMAENLNPPFMPCTVRNICCKDEAGTRHTAYITWIFRSIVALKCSQLHYTLEHAFVENLGLCMAF